MTLRPLAVTAMEDGLACGGRRPAAEGTRCRARFSGKKEAEVLAEVRRR